jgi:hypothetical protein
MLHNAAQIVGSTEAEGPRFVVCRSRAAMMHLDAVLNDFRRFLVHILVFEHKNLALSNYSSEKLRRCFFRRLLESEAQF